MIELRWLVSAEITTQQPKLQYREVINAFGGFNIEPNWMDVLVVVEAIDQAITNTGDKT
jgi:hypothetical protein